MKYTHLYPYFCIEQNNSFIIGINQIRFNFFTVIYRVNSRKNSIKSNLGIFHKDYL